MIFYYIIIVILEFKLLLVADSFSLSLSVCLSVCVFIYTHMPVLHTYTVGFARDFDDGNDSMLTLCGTKGYAAPEIFLGKPYSGKAADVYSIGVVAHMSMGGYLPFKDGGVTVIFHQERWDDVSYIAKQFIQQCLTHSPSQRMSSENLMKSRFFDT